MKRIFVSVLLVFVLCLGIVSSGDAAQITNGYAYLTCNKSYLTPGQPVIFTATAQGGSGGYQYRFVVYCQPDSNPYEYLICAEREYETSNTITFTPTVYGSYSVDLYVKDSSGNTLNYFSPKFETSSGSALSNKVKAVAAQCNASASGSYGKALFMHDWIINNASYSSGGAYANSAEGVLLYGAGVCESYALAYQMLLSEVGVSSIFVGGYAGGDHAWNLVYMDGYWYHVDVTWDDPIGGSLRRKYFGLPDAFMLRDHSWEGNYPGCTATACYWGTPQPAGWFQVGSQWYNLSTNGFIRTGWNFIGADWFYMNLNGVMQTGWLSDGGNWYYLSAGGGMVKGTQTIGGIVYTFNSSGVLIGETVAADGWQQENGNWYYYIAGVKQTGWLNSGTSWYYLSSTGVMKTGWVQDAGKWYFFKSSGIMSTGWLQDGSSWFYMNSSGVMKTGWLQQGSSWYYLLGNGAMATGTHTIDGQGNSFNSSGVWLGYI